MPEDIKRHCPISACQSAIFRKPNGQSVCFSLVRQIQTWEAAKTVCKGLGGRLPVILSAKENTFIQNFATVRKHCV